jgi:hypothetical protein
MSYVAVIDSDGLKFVVGDMFGVGFRWDDKEFAEAVKNRDSRIWDVLEWAVDGHAEKYNTARLHEELTRYSDALNFLRHMDKSDVVSLLSNEYASDGLKKLVSSYLDGSLREKRKEISETKPAVKKKLPGFVYLILAENGLYKIGKAKDVSSRLRPFSVTFPMKFSLVHSFHSDNYSLAEAKLHDEFDGKRDVGEWFRLDSKDVEYIVSIKDGEL